MNTFVLAAIIASATFGLASANKDECSPKIMMFVNAKNNCPDECSTGMVMQKIIMLEFIYHHH